MAGGCEGFQANAGVNGFAGDLFAEDGAEEDEVDLSGCCCGDFRDGVTGDADGCWLRGGEVGEVGAEFGGSVRLRGPRRGEVKAV